MAYTSKYTGQEIDGRLDSLDTINQSIDTIQSNINNKVSKTGDTITGNLGITGGLTIDGDVNVKGGSIELNGDGTLAGYGGFIDFHYDRTNKDFTSRIIEDAEGRLSVTAPNGFRVNSKLLLDLTYPVGSIYMSTSSTSPASLFGGTWTQLKNRFLLGAGSSYSNGATGGAATHTLTVNEMPSHTHVERLIAKTLNDTAGSASATGYATNIGWWSTMHVHDSNQYTGSTGGGAAHNNMPPYLAVYMWKRTA